MMKFNNQFRHTLIIDLRLRQIKATNDHHLRWKPLKRNFQKLFPILGKIFYYFLVTLNNFEPCMHHRVRVYTGGRTDRQIECISIFELF